MKNNAVILENSLAVPHNVTHRLTMLPIYSTARYTLKIKRCICTNMQTHTKNKNIHSIIIHYNKKSINNLKDIINAWIRRRIRTLLREG